MIQNTKYKTAINLRRQGKSYLEISRSLGISKGTLSYWFSRETWSEEIKGEARKQFPQLLTNPLFLLGLGLYWGEGDKTHNGRVAVVNSDPRLLKVIVDFYKHVLEIPHEMIRAGVFVYSDHDRDASRLYWSQTLDVPLDQFIKTQTLPSRTQRTKRRTPYGMCSAYFSSTEFSIRIREWIEMLYSQYERE